MRIRPQHLQGKLWLTVFKHIGRKWFVTREFCQNWWHSNILIFIGWETMGTRALEWFLAGHAIFSTTTWGETYSSSNFQLPVFPGLPIILTALSCNGHKKIAKILHWCLAKCRISKFLIRKVEVALQKERVSVCRNTRLVTTCISRLTHVKEAVIWLFRRSKISRQEHCCTSNEMWINFIFVSVSRLSIFQ